jgi:hypothetical protein
MKVQCAQKQLDTRPVRNRTDLFPSDVAIAIMVEQHKAGRDIPMEFIEVDIAVAVGIGVTEDLL